VLQLLAFRSSGRPLQCQIL
ncbi:putative tail fiber domain protein, partial [Escherichia coli 95.0943]